MSLTKHQSSFSI